MSRDPDYCSQCFTAAKKAGRSVRMTPYYEWPICSLCESRLREGLVHYRPSNGTEGDLFEAQCERCRHYRPMSDDGERAASCKLKILDRVFEQMWSDYDAACHWFMPDVLKTTLAGGSPCCPAECLKFSPPGDGDDANGTPIVDCPGQLMLDDLWCPHEPAAAERARPEPARA